MTAQPASLRLRKAWQGLSEAAGPGPARRPARPVHQWARPSAPPRVVRRHRSPPRASPGRRPQRPCPRDPRGIRKRPVLFTTNKSPLTHWGDVLHDRDLADAIVDRTLERGRLILMDGPSSRTKHLDLDAACAPGDAPEPASFSGTAPAKFQEPAPGPRPAFGHPPKADPRPGSPGLARPTNRCRPADAAPRGSRQNIFSHHSTPSFPRRFGVVSDPPATPPRTPAAAPRTPPTPPGGLRAPPRGARTHPGDGNFEQKAL